MNLFLYSYGDILMVAYLNVCSEMKILSWDLIQMLMRKPSNICMRDPTKAKCALESIDFIKTLTHDWLLAVAVH